MYFEIPRQPAGDGRIRASRQSSIGRQKASGKRFLKFCRDAQVGSPGDPLIGLPVFFNFFENLGRLLGTDHKIHL